MKKRVLVFLLAAVMCFQTAVIGVKSTEVATGTCGNSISWTLDDDGTLTISGTGEIPASSAPWSKYWSDVKDIIIEQGITVIGDRAFYPYIPNPGNGGTYPGYGGMVGAYFAERVSIPESVTKIGRMAFQCSVDTYFFIPPTVTEIDALCGIHMIYGYEGTAAEAYASSNQYASFVALTAEGTIGESISWMLTTEGVLHLYGRGTMPDYSDTSPAPWESYKSRIKSVIIGSRIANIGANAFSGCSVLNEVVFRGGMNSIGDSAFAGCSALTDISLPMNITSIGSKAFSCCTALDYILLSSNITTIGEEAFGGCPLLTIRGNKDSSAEEYAEANGIPFEKLYAFGQMDFSDDNASFTIRYSPDYKNTLTAAVITDARTANYTWTGVQPIDITDGAYILYEINTAANAIHVQEVFGNAGNDEDDTYKISGYIDLEVYYDASSGKISLGNGQVFSLGYDALPDSPLKSNNYSSSVAGNFLLEGNSSNNSEIYFNMSSVRFDLYIVNNHVVYIEKNPEELEEEKEKILNNIFRREFIVVERLSSSDESCITVTAASTETNSIDQIKIASINGTRVNQNNVSQFADALRGVFRIVARDGDMVHLTQAEPLAIGHTLEIDEYGYIHGTNGKDTAAGLTGNDFVPVSDSDYWIMRDNRDPDKTRVYTRSKISEPMKLEDVTVYKAGNGKYVLEAGEGTDLSEFYPMAGTNYYLYTKQINLYDNQHYLVNNSLNTYNYSLYMTNLMTGKVDIVQFENDIFWGGGYTAYEIYSKLQDGYIYKVEDGIASSEAVDAGVTYASGIGAVAAFYNQQKEYITSNPYIFTLSAEELSAQDDGTGIGAARYIRDTIHAKMVAAFMPSSIANGYYNSKITLITQKDNKQLLSVKGDALISYDNPNYIANTSPSQLGAILKNADSVTVYFAIHEEEQRATAWIIPAISEAAALNLQTAAAPVYAAAPNNTAVISRTAPAPSGKITFSGSADIPLPKTAQRTECSFFAFPTVTNSLVRIADAYYTADPTKKVEYSVTPYGYVTLYNAEAGDVHFVFESKNPGYIADNFAREFIVVENIINKNDNGILVNAFSTETETVSRITVRLVRDQKVRSSSAVDTNTIYRVVSRDGDIYHIEPATPLIEHHTLVFNDNGWVLGTDGTDRPNGFSADAKVPLTTSDFFLMGDNRRGAKKLYVTSEFPERIPLEDLTVYKTSDNDYILKAGKNTDASKLAYALRPLSFVMYSAALNQGNANQNNSYDNGNYLYPSYPNYGYSSTVYATDLLTGEVKTVTIPGEDCITYPESALDNEPEYVPGNDIPANVLEKEMEQYGVWALPYANTPGYHYYSDNTSVATVNSLGYIIANNIGSANIYIHNGVSTIMKIRLIVTSITDENNTNLAVRLSVGDSSLYVGQITPVFSCVTNFTTDPTQTVEIPANIEFSISDTCVITISDSILRGVGEGCAELVATLKGTSISTSVTINVDDSYRPTYPSYPTNSSLTDGRVYEATDGLLCMNAPYSRFTNDYYYNEYPYTFADGVRAAARYYNSAAGFIQRDQYWFKIGTQVTNRVNYINNQLTALGATSVKILMHDTTNNTLTSNAGKIEEYLNGSDMVTVYYAIRTTGEATAWLVIENITYEIGWTEIPKSAEDQIATLTLSASDQITLDSIRFKVNCDAPLVLNRAYMNHYNGSYYTMQELSCTNGVVSGVPSDGLYTGSSLVTLEFTVPGGTPVGTYYVTLTDLLITDGDYIWETPESVRGYVEVYGTGTETETETETGTYHNLHHITNCSAYPNGRWEYTSKILHGSSYPPYHLGYVEDKALLYNPTTITMNGISYPVTIYKGSDATLTDDQYDITIPSVTADVTHEETYYTITFSGPEGLKLPSAVYQQTRYSYFQFPVSYDTPICIADAYYTADPTQKVFCTITPYGYVTLYDANPGNIHVVFEEAESYANVEVSILSQPVSAKYSAGGEIRPLTVSASASAGTLRYQWYENIANSKIGVTAIPGATSASYTPSAAVVGTKYYYAVVTAVDAAGNVLAKTVSDVAEITVKEGVPTGIITKPMINPDFSDADIPEALQQLGMDTVAKIETLMKTEIQKIIDTSKEIAAELYDVILMYSEDGGQNWIKADETHFPSNGRLLVTLPVPEGTNPDTHEYTILHMFTSSAFGKTPGKVENPTYTTRKDENGAYYLDFYVTGLSPITIGWTEKEAEPTLDPNMIQLLLMMMTQNFDITAETSEGGSVILSADKVKFDKSATITIVPDEGYTVDTVTVNGKAVEVTDNAVTLKHIRKDQKIEVTFVKLPWVNPFRDVSADADYLDALAYVCENGLFNGESATEFNPDGSMTRAMFVTVLGRMAGVGDEFGTGDFADVDPLAWYAPYVGWAKFAGITTGDGTGNFGADDALTVEEAIVFLMRYRAHMGYPTESDASLADYADAADVSDWATDAIAWAVEHGIYIGDSGNLNPKANVSRAMVAQMLYNFCMVFDPAK